eukprot:9238923-Pyramimonas_sp.AAC.2
MDGSPLGLGPFFGGREYLGGESNLGGVANESNKGLMCAWSNDTHIRCWLARGVQRCSTTWRRRAPATSAASPSPPPRSSRRAW